MLGRDTLLVPLSRGVSESLRLAREMASHQAPRLRGCERRLGLLAERQSGDWAPGVEAATSRRRERRRDLAAEQDWLTLAFLDRVRQWDRAQKRRCVWM